MRADQVLDRAPAISGDGGEEFEGHRQDAAARRIRMARIEEARFIGIGDQPLNHDVDPGRVTAQHIGHGARILHQPHPGPFAADVRLQHHGIGEAEAGHGARRLRLRRGTGLEHGIRRDPVARRAADLVKNRTLALAAEAAGGDGRVGEGRQREVPVPQPEQNPVEHERAVQDPVGQKLEGRRRRLLFTRGVVAGTGDSAAQTALKA